MYSLFFMYDVFIVPVFTLICWFITRKSRYRKGYLLFLLSFFSIYIVGFYVLSLHVGRAPAKDMALFFLLPSLAIAHWTFPFKKSKTVGKLLLSLAGIYILFLILLSLIHGFSRM